MRNKETVFIVCVQDALFGYLFKGIRAKRNI